jgi:hypothetical protein
MALPYYLKNDGSYVINSVEDVIIFCKNLLSQFDYIRLIAEI